jgi:hypothetical protein
MIGKYNKSSTTISHSVASAQNRISMIRQQGSLATHCAKKQRGRTKKYMDFKEK